MSAMSNPSLIPAGLPVPGSGETTAPARGTAPSQTEAAPTTKPVQLFVNPSYRFDPTVGLVVIEFHNDTGGVSNSIPSARQLEAYRTHQETPPGEVPPQNQSVTLTVHALESEGHTIKPGDAKTSAG
jgi:hypothetical protein